MKKIKINIYSVSTDDLNELIERGAVETTADPEKLLIDKEEFREVTGKNGEEEEQEPANNGQNQEQQEKQEEPKKEEKNLDSSLFIKPKNYDYIKANLEVGNIPLLVGQAGIGKTEICIHLAQDLNLSFYTESSVNDQYTFKGFIDAKGVYQETQFYKAFVNGGLFLLDEIDNCDASVLVSINTALANGCYAFANGTFKKHPDFKLIATANTYGDGASFDYVGRNQLDRSSLDRFAAIACTPDKRIESKLSSDKNLIAFLQNVRKACNTLENHIIISYRSFIKLDRMRKYADTFGLETILKDCIFPNVSKEELYQIMNSLPASSDIYTFALAKLAEAL